MLFKKQNCFDDFNACAEWLVKEKYTTSGRTGANDSRVDPLHAKKFTAALQNNPGQINPVMLYIDYNVGHGSGQATKQRIENSLVDFEFILNQLGL
jgi:prolyl oligopeptidase PreP (S9A serine peptidase family)